MTRKNCHAFLQLDKGANGSIVAVGRFKCGGNCVTLLVKKKKGTRWIFALF